MIVSNVRVLHDSITPFDPHVREEWLQLLVIIFHRTSARDSGIYHWVAINNLITLNLVQSAARAGSISPFRKTTWPAGCVAEGSVDWYISLFFPRVWIYLGGGAWLVNCCGLAAVFWLKLYGGRSCKAPRPWNAFYCRLILTLWQSPISHWILGACVCMSVCVFAHSHSPGAVANWTNLHSRGGGTRTAGDLIYVQWGRGQTAT